MALLLTIEALSVMHLRPPLISPVASDVQVHRTCLLASAAVSRSIGAADVGRKAPGVVNNVGWASAPLAVGDVYPCNAAWCPDGSATELVESVLGVGLEGKGLPEFPPICNVRSLFETLRSITTPMRPV